MRARHFGWIPVLTILSLPTAAAGGCRIAMTPPIAVTMLDLRPTVMTRINGVNARFLIDTGAFFSLMSPAAASEYKLPLHDTPTDNSLWGIATRQQRSGSRVTIQGFGGGETAVRIASVKAFNYVGMPLQNVEFLVGGNTIGGPDIVGALGENLLQLTDTEFDFSNGMMRLVRPIHCGDRPVDYWAGKGQAVASVDLHNFYQTGRLIVGQGAVDGHRISILFDTGSPRSFLSLAAAERIGITPHSPGVTPAGITWGIAGDNTVKVWLAPIADLAIGTEEIQHTHLFIAAFQHDMNQGRVDMVVGMDFFLSHHLFVSYGQQRLYFTYTGGPVFDLGLPAADWKHTPTAAPAPVRAAGAAPAATGATTAPVPETAPGDSANAAALMNRGMAYAAQLEFTQALADLEHACRLAPGNAQCQYHLGVVYWRDKQPAVALPHFNAAIRLSPGDYHAYLARAQLQLSQQGGPKPGATTAEHGIQSDLDTVDRLVPAQADLRLTLGGLYDDIGRSAAAIHQLDVWISYHQHDILLATALNDECWFRAKADLELNTALTDCNRALDRAPRDPDILDSRGLVYLRLGQLQRAIEDYDTALKINSRMATSLYGRGLAELRNGEKTQGQADLTAALKIAKGTGQRFVAMGLVP